MRSTTYVRRAPIPGLQVPDHEALNQGPMGAPLPQFDHHRTHPRFPLTLQREGCYGLGADTKGAGVGHKSIPGVRPSRKPREGKGEAADGLSR